MCSKATPAADTPHATFLAGAVHAATQPAAIANTSKPISTPGSHPAEQPGTPTAGSGRDRSVVHSVRRSSEGGKVATAARAASLAA